MQNRILELLPNLRRVAFALTGDLHDADDLVQSTVERVLVKRPPAGVPLIKWVLRVCRNIWIDEIRKRKVRVASDIDNMPHEISNVDGEQIALGRIALGQVNSAMKRLPEAQQTTLALAAFSGLSYLEISDILDVPVGTVMSRIARARASLNRTLNRNRVETPSIDTSTERYKHDLH